MEIWKNVIGYESLYQISNLGNVKSLQKMKKTKNKFGNVHYYLTKEKILKNTIRKDGYKCLVLVKNEIKKTVNIHRIVLASFEPNDNLKNLQVNHKDGNKANNNINNLEWTTAKENTLHAHKNNLCQKGMSHHKSKQIICTKTNIIYESITDAKNKLKIHNIGAMLNGNRTNKTTLKFTKL
jgi:hypothetical protein